MAFIISVTHKHFGRTIVPLAVIFQFRKFFTDVTQAYIQRREKPQRDTYLKSFKVFGLNDEKMLHLLKPLYRVSGSGDYWERTFQKHIQTDMNMDNCISDTILFYKMDNRGLIGICANYVHDNLHAGNLDFVESIYRAPSRNKWPCLRHTLKEVYQKRFKAIQKHRFLLDKISTCSVWLGRKFTPGYQLYCWSSLPNNGWKVQLWFQNKDKKNKFCFIAFGKVIWFRLIISKLGEKINCSQSLLGFFLATNHNKSSQFGYFRLISDENGKFYPIHSVSYRPKQWTRSVLGGMVMAFTGSFDIAITLKYYFERMLRSKVHLGRMTGYLFLFYVLTKSSATK